MAEPKKNRGTLAVVILTYNEELNIAQALESVFGWANEVFILDSMSTDRTVELARKYGCQIERNNFENYSKQRNHALDHLPIRSEWVLFLDADEWMPDAIKREITRTITAVPKEDGFYLNRRLIWMGKWIRRGYYPSKILRLFRHGKGHCEDRSVNEHMIVDGPVGQLDNDFIHQDRKGVTDWIAKHNGYATREALELILVRGESSNIGIEAHLFGAQAERKRWLRQKVWNRLPPLIRPFGYFIYRYVLTGGFLDGKAAFVYHFLQALWYPLLIDVKYLELKMNKDKTALKDRESVVPGNVSRMSWQRRALDRFYDRARGFVDGTTEFHRLCEGAIPQGSRILEIGAGPSNPSSDFFAARGVLTGLDVDLDVRGNRALTRFEVFDGTRFPFEDDSFDACVSNYVLEHVPNPVLHLTEIRRVLRPGGTYVFRTPNLFHYVALVSFLTPHWFHELVANRLRGLPQDAHDPYPTVHAMNTRAAVRRVARAAALEIDVCRMIEKEPSYGMASPLLFYPLMAYERVVNSSERFAGLRSNILAVLRKPRA